MAFSNHVIAFSSFLSPQNILATVTKRIGSLSTFLMASRLRGFLCVLGSRCHIFSLQSKPELGHSCSAFDIRTLACGMLLARRSTRTLSTHNSGFLGIARRARSRTDLALTIIPHFSSNLEASSHNGTDLGHARVPVPYASRAWGNLFCAS